MAIMGMDMALKNKAFLATLLAAITPLTYANEWQFDPTIRVNETYSDNVKFDNKSVTDLTSSFVNQLGLGLTANYKSTHTTFNVEAEALQATYSHDSQLNDSFLTLNGNVNVNLWSSGFALIGSANIQNKAKNSYLSPYADLISGDTTRYEQYSGGFSYNVRNRKYTISSSLLFNTTKAEDGLGEQEGYSASFNSANGTSADTVFWDIDASIRKRESRGNTADSKTGEIKVGYISPFKFNPFLRIFQEDNTGSIGSGSITESDAVGLGFRWHVIPRLFFDVSYNTPAGEESESAQDNYFDLNVNWQPTKRTKLIAGRSQRFYGDSYNFSLSHESRRLTNTISYDESIETFTRDDLIFNNVGIFQCDPTLLFPSIAGGTCFGLLADNIPDNYVFREVFEPTIVEDNSFSLNKKLSWQSRLALSRTTFTLTLNKIDRLNLETDVENKTERLTFKISRKISGYSTLNLTNLYTKTMLSVGLPNASKNHHRMYKIDYERDLNKTLSMTLGLSHQNRDSTPTLFKYTENRISLELKKVL